MRFYKSAPRGRPTDEFIPFIQEFGPGVIPKQLGFNKKLAGVITGQILERRFSLEEIIEVAPRVKCQLFEEVPCDYGIRMGNQLETAIERLLKDSDTRRAIVVMGRPDDKVPCCIMLIQFFIRNRELITVAYMRSWDIGLGYAYDVDTFQKLGAYVAFQLGIKQGNLIVMTGSGHFYRRACESDGGK